MLNTLKTFKADINNDEFSEEVVELAAAPPRNTEFEKNMKNIDKNLQSMVQIMNEFTSSF